MTLSLGLLLLAFAAPQWSWAEADEDAWRAAFDTMARDLLPDGDLPIPTAVYQVSTPAERARLRKEALALKAWSDGLMERAVTLYYTVTPAQRAAIMAGTADQATIDHWNAVSVQMEAMNENHRQKIREARDRLLAPGVLSPDCAYALTRFVDQRKLARSAPPAPQP